MCTTAFFEIILIFVFFPSNRILKILVVDLVCPCQFLFVRTLTVDIFLVDVVLGAQFHNEVITPNPFHISVRPRGHRDSVTPSPLPALRRSKNIPSPALKTPKVCCISPFSTSGWLYLSDYYHTCVWFGNNVISNTVRRVFRIWCPGGRVFIGSEFAATHSSNDS